jgi:hypothetical protein
MHTDEHPGLGRLVEPNNDFFAVPIREHVLEAHGASLEGRVETEAAGAFGAARLPLHARCPR